VETKEKIYWLKDAAGTGKTTVAATCARDWQVKQTLAGRFFFTPNSEASSGIDRFCTTVAKDIAFLVPSLDSVITAALDELSRLRCGFHEQFERLISKPLQSSKLSHPVILIFDALDNCDHDGRRMLLSCLLEHLPSLSHVKVLLTSRPSPDIVDILSKSSLVGGQEVQLLDIHDEIRTDVRIYVHSTLTRLENQEREKVVEYSGGLFIVAATACRMLRLSAQPTALLQKLLTADSKDHLDELYLEVLRQAVWNGGAHEKMMSILQIIIVTLQPVSINTIAHFLSAKFDVGKFVQDLGAVLKDGHPERPIKVLHPTFREFMAEEDRANGFLVNPVSSHALAAMGCLNALQQALDDDLLRLRNQHQVLPRNEDVQDLNSRLAVATTAAVRYASSYWTHHVAASLNDTELWSRTLEFLTTRLLNWLELMSWRGNLGDCVKGLSQLRTTMLRSLREQQGSAVRALPPIISSDADLP
jgi:NACHT domain